jgi:hypothetical protein
MGAVKAASWTGGAVGRRARREIDFTIAARRLPRLL